MDLLKYARTLLATARKTGESQEEAQAIHDVIHLLSNTMTEDVFRLIGHSRIDGIIR